MISSNLAVNLRGYERIHVKFVIHFDTYSIAASSFSSSIFATRSTSAF